MKNYSFYSLKALLLSIVLFSISVVAVGQKAKKQCKIGDKNFKNERYKEAIINYTTALEIQSNYLDAYVGRAKSYEKIKDLDNALKDFKKAITYDVDNPDLNFKAGNILYLTNSYEEAIKNLDKAVTFNPKFEEAYIRLGIIHMELKNWTEAASSWVSVIDLNKGDNPYYYFYLGLVSDSINDYLRAEVNYQKAVNRYKDAKSIKNDPLKEKKYKIYHFYVNLGRMQWKQVKNDLAMGNYKSASLIDKDAPLPHYLMGKLQYQQKKYNEAIVHFQNAIMRDKNYVKAYYLRGCIRRLQGEYQQGIADFDKAIQLKSDYTIAYYQRGICYQEIKAKEEARNDFIYAQTYFSKKENEKFGEDLKKRFFELSRETNPPTIKITSKFKNNHILIARGAAVTTFVGQAFDENLVKSIKIAGKEAIFDPDLSNPDFKINMASPFSEKYDFQVTDIYDNKETYTYNVIFHEVIAPKVTILMPYTSTLEKRMFVTGDQSAILVQGEIDDQSMISSIMVDGKEATFNSNRKNPTFELTLPIAGKTAVLVEVIDEYGNKFSQAYDIEREAATKESHMGRTLLVFIENSKYDNFGSLEGPKQDASMIKNALIPYNISSVSHKRNLTKENLTTFFKKDLGELLKKARVKSLIIWYAGHGKYMNDRGYWIPVDARRGKELDYFSINDLQANLQWYQSRGLKHILVISDACESGPSFLTARRDANTTKPACAYSATNYPNSVQVLTSSGYESAADESLFTKKFANALESNQDPCISINEIASKVITSLKNAQKKEPKFGSIKGLVDEGGTFIFYKKE